MTEERTQAALKFIQEFGDCDGAHHKQWVLDQVVRLLTGCSKNKVVGFNHQGESFTYEVLGESDEYVDWIRELGNGEDGPDTYEWDEGSAP